ncbi:MAG: hypothetical protein P8I55_04980 [Crocinitomix sp.]|nr:hypothetical protein [Crocinitomix sp.]
MKTVFILLFCLLSFVSFSQIETIDARIAEYDAKIAEAIAEEMEEITPHLSTSCPLMLPAIGPVNHEIDIYFEHYQEESGADGVGMKTICSIRKVSF